MKEKKTEARRIMEARHASYARYPDGIYDETDILLMQQDIAERLEKEKDKDD